MIRKLDSMVEKRRLYYRQINKFCNSDGAFKKLPFRIIRKVLVNVVFWVGDKVELVRAVVECGILGTLDVSRPPVAVDETPGPLQKDGGPRIPESRSVKFHTRLVAGTF